nr:MAG TPA: hypothetical protein [Bacteriophage sp.]
MAIVLDWMAILSIDWRFCHCDGWSWNRIISWCCVESVLLGGVI